MAEEKITKKKSKVVVVIIVAILAVVALGVAILLLLNGKKSYRSVKIETYEGEVKLKREGGDQKIFKGIKLIPDDKVKTKEESTAVLLVDDDKHIVAEENTCFSIHASGSEKSGSVSIHLEYGSSLITIDHKLSENSEFEVTTPNASCSVRGTTFSVSYDPDNETTIVKVTEGIVKVRGGGDSARLEAGDEAIITEDELLVSPAGGQGRGSDTDGNGSGDDDGEERPTEAGSPLEMTMEGFVLFGSYEQDGDASNGPEPIEWQVVDQNENGTLLLSRYVLDGAQYNDERTDVTWETSSFRKWLNSDFYNLAFNQKEQARINTVTLVNEDNQLFGTPGGKDTKDRVFVLSLPELRHYFYFDSWDADNYSGYCASLIARGTTHAVHEGVALGVITEGFYNRTLAEKNYGLGCIGMEGSAWWIRYAGGESTLACYVGNDGSTGARGSNSVVTYTHGVRPAIYINW
jgi:hypothetical protein